MGEFELPDEVREEARTAWHRYLDELNSFRPDLHRYCLKLTRDLWDAEDLVQDTLLRGFSTLGSVHHAILNPRGYLLRIASNLWIDTMRRRGAEASALSAAANEPAPSAPSPVEITDVRSAGAALMKHLSPQQRAAVVLKDVFDMSLEETAGVLSTTVGAVKAALHRGRSRLSEPAPTSTRRPTPSVALVDRFVERLNARDLDGLLTLMLDTGSVQTGYLLEVGRNEFEAKGGWFWSAVYGHPTRPRKLQAWDLRNERILFQDEPICIALNTRDGVEALTSVMRFEEEDGRISRVHAYSSPELVHAMGEALGLPVRSFGLYRPPTPGPGKYWPTPAEGDSQ